MHTNNLIHASSPYLLQHAHNPVNWHEWNDEAWQKARNENKPVLVSIGYSACHWCHVMERESFENEDTAAIMNEYFVCIKVDREERPDVDQVYMDAVQLITGRGGWPLNMFCLPDGRPLHGGTYFPNREWNQLLFQLHTFYKDKKPEAEEFATRLTEGVKGMDALGAQPATEKFNPADINTLIELWKPAWDWKEGGNERVPKFMMPNNWEMLLGYAQMAKNDEALKFVQLTLDKIGRGGINDQLGGGFARYSTDGVWLAPHFEKMLYDNAQLVSLYAHAYKATQNPYYREVIEKTLDFVQRELTNTEGGFYSALDADSEGEEGKFYVWTKEELVNLLGEDEALFSAYYNITAIGNWEHGNNILHTKQSREDFAIQNQLVLGEWETILGRCERILMEVRSQRIRPGLDDKSICCWNALMLKGYADAYMATGNETYLETALKNKAFIEKNFLRQNRLFRIYKDGKSTINAFLEDYACLIDAYIQLYQCTFDNDLLTTAQTLVQTCMDEFYDATNQLFYFTSKLDPPLAARKTTTGDDVISSANSIMVHNLYKLAYYMDNSDYKTTANGMLAKVAQQVKKYPGWYSHWCFATMYQAYGIYQIVIIGPEANKLYKKFTSYIPNALFSVSLTENNNLPLLENRYVPNETLIYVCHNETCQLPVKTVEEALEMMIG